MGGGRRVAGCRPGEGFETGLKRPVAHALSPLDNQFT